MQIIRKLQNDVQSLERSNQCLGPPKHLQFSKLNIQISPLNPITTEVRKIIPVDENGVVFNVYDHLPLEIVKLGIFNTIGIAHHKCNCVRLRNNLERYVFSQPFPFSSETAVETFIINCEIVARSIPFTKI